MAKKRFRRSRKWIKNTFQIRFWLDESRIKAFFLYILDVLKRLLIPQKQVPEESFAQAKKRLKLTDELLEKRKRSLFILSVFMIFLAILIISYAIYQMTQGGYLGAIVGFSVSVIAFALAFRYHFWYFQFDQEKLGCSFKVWLQEGLLGGKKS